MEKGVLRNILVTKTNLNYPLKGKINPTFQNEGTAVAYIDGRKLLPGESYSVNVPNVILQNNIPITFESDPSKKPILYIGFVEIQS